MPASARCSVYSMRGTACLGRCGERVQFPVAVDRRIETERLPQTMRAFGMRGTPTLILIDRKGRVAFHGFCRHFDLEVGFQLDAFLDGTLGANETEGPFADGCDEAACLLP